ncbi:Z1 domain-containing protein [Paenisporosarcina sp. TG20]|uniref:Z1 domain-containing protein n=1 Tax=Paenisporosarcina sp. TG20 TaxID=1211706 RepID=UPI000474A924
MKNLNINLLESLISSGNFFCTLKNKNNYDFASQKVIEQTVRNLKEVSTSSNKPGMLLGKIQSGKTRTFIGIMGLAYDNGYDLVIILTKNSNALTKQTFERLENEFENLIQEDEMAVFDIMSMPENLRNYELKKKMAIVLKKEKKNMERLQKALFETYPSLSERRILFIDDEADFASVAYENNKERNIIELKVIAGQIDKLRSNLQETSYLQVTATPYSLYLQPEDMTVNEHKVYQPKRPAFTELVPVHDKYIGGEMYFERSKIEGDIGSYLYHEIDENELGILKKSDRRRVKSDTLLTNSKFSGIRNALVNFIVGGSIRNLQNKINGEKPSKFAFIIHTMTSKIAHQWQEDLVLEIEEKLVESYKTSEPIFNELIKEAYHDLARSKIENCYFPTFKDVYSKVCESLVNQELLISIVNSEKDVNQLLDKSGQLKLRTPLNIFIGGQILDRGITIGNLIGFYYGRNPKKFQQDTVLQHSRMYGARPMEDIAVTRFYTTQKIYDVMERMHEFDSELRKAFESGANNGEVVFIQRDLQNQILPCSPNKIMLSSINMIKPSKRFLPIGFDTLPKSKMIPKIKKIDNYIEQLIDTALEISPEDKQCYLIKLNDALILVEMIHETLVMEEGYEWDLEAYNTLLNYLAKEYESENHEKVWLILRHNRNIARIRKSSRRFEDAPDTSSSKLNEYKIAKKVAVFCPAIILTRQLGETTGEFGWKHNTPFYWPILVAPANTIPTVFANKHIK